MLSGLPFRTSSVDVPAGMAAALEQTVHERGIPAVGIWAQVPHYVASMSYPAASVALLEGLATPPGCASRRPSCGASRCSSASGSTSSSPATTSTRR